MREHYADVRIMGLDRLSDTLPSCEQEPLLTGKPVAVTNKIMAFVEKCEQDIEVQMGLGVAGWRKRLRVNTDKRSL
jgi:hypothetical protein